MEPISRRQLLAISAAVAAVPAFRHRIAPATGGVAFGIGVCSGDPDESSAVLWTRLTGPDGTALGGGDVGITWELSGDEEFIGELTTGEVVALAIEAHSVHVVVGLDGPAYFRFRAGDAVSPVGRVAPTPPSGSPEASTLRIAAASCQHFETGFYAAHRDIAEWSPDLVAFLGDFIYEYGADAFGGAIVRSHGTPEVQTLDDYRRRYTLYLGDEHLQASRAACPWLVIWDDHEVENNYAGLVPEHAEDASGFAARRLAAYQAWWEHMPVRMARPEDADDLTIYRSVAWGGLADIVLLDGRQYRDDQACGDAVLQLDPPCDEALDPQRTMLGTSQEEWLNRELAASTATWAVLGQQTVVSDVRLPTGAILNYDQWDGYDGARQRLLLAAAQTERTIVLTGDIHLAGVGTLPGVGVEFVTTGISSPGLVPADLEPVVTALPAIVASELAHRGYTRHVVTPDTWTAEFRIVDDVADAGSPVSTWETFTVSANSRDAVVVG